MLKKQIILRVDHFIHVSMNVNEIKALFVILANK